MNQKEREIEDLVETLIRMLGKSNERVMDLTKRVHQLEAILRESMLPASHSIQQTNHPAAPPGYTS